MLLVTALLAALWLGAAFYFQFPFAIAVVLQGVLVIGVVALGVLAWRRLRLAWLLLAGGVCVAALWWLSIQPSNNRDWAPDVAWNVTGDVSGSRLTLNNVRNFNWDSETAFEEIWDAREYDLDKLQSVDLFTSVWDSPAIAHTLFGFNFSDGQRVVFSAEIRREKTEAFSAIGGFFKKFELAMIAAEESDIIRLRTNARGEQVSRYRLNVTPNQARALLLALVAKGNELTQRPQFYQTITSNCTTVVFQLARLIEPKIPLDWRILLSGYLPDYLYELGVIDNSKPLEDVKREADISARAKDLPAGANYSAGIRGE
jgi:hypothetical protein